ncbi:MAG: GIY-YIG nuclease family protein [bacterium]|nr:GIY-YIG nuclease family protein [bacterium]
MQEKHYCVYVMMNKWNTTSYIGVTSNLSARIWQHQQKVVEGFTKKYNLNKLVFYEIFDDALTAIAREKQLKRWSRSKKIALIKTMNPTLDDLSKTLV